MKIKYIDAGAELSACGNYRYLLWRVWNEYRPMAVFVMLNPSTADANTDDPTIRRCVQFASENGYGGLFVVNIFAYRATDPASLPIGSMAVSEIGLPDINLKTILGACQKSEVIVAGWGKHWQAQANGRMLTRKIQDAGFHLHCLGLNKDGSPKHPLYIKSGTPLIPFVVK